MDAAEYAAQHLPALLPTLDEGYTRRAQCVPCGAIHPPVIGPGWKSPNFRDPDAVHPDYRLE